MSSQSTFETYPKIRATALCPIAQGTMSFPPNSFIIDSTSSIFREFPSLLPQLNQITSPFSNHKMSGYSRIKKSAANRSKSVDFAELSLTRSAPSSSRFVESQQTVPDPIKQLAAMRDSIAENDRDGVGELFGDILGRKCGGASGRFVAAEWGSAPAKRSFSVKRSASVSYGYSRIHHQAAEDGDQCGDELISSRSRSSCLKKKGKLFRAVRRLFGL